MLNVFFVSFLLGVDIRVDINHLHQLFSPNCYFLFAYVDVISKNHYPHMRIQITILEHQHTLYIYIYIYIYISHVYINLIDCVAFSCNT
jgi:hypothetical protein